VILPLLGFLVLPNLPLLFAGRSLNLICRGYADLDYLLIGLLALFLPRAVTFVLLLLAIFADFVQAACATYLFAPSEFVNSIRFGGMLSTTRAAVLAWTVVGVLLTCLLAALCARRWSWRDRCIAAGELVLLLLLLPLLQAITNHRRLGAVEESVAVTRMPSLSLIRKQRTYDRYERGERLAGMFAMPSASAIAMGHLRDLTARNAAASPAAALPNFVQILVESWGQAKDDALRTALLAAYRDPRLVARYRVLEGTMPFEGPTTSGEARELCQTHIGFNAAHGSVEQMQRCLPALLRGLGYQTLGVHGFKGAMFDRNVWYPQMGFQEVWFEDRLHGLGLPDCPGPFSGTCDAAVADWLSGRLEQPRAAPLFVHWVTLNSHLPVPVPAPLMHPASCYVSAETQKEPTLCAWYQLEAVVQDSVRKMALQRLDRPTIFVIVGDHAPPFDRQGIRGRFSSTEVPYVILLPKAADGTASVR
jgi:hypothetical protein